MPRKSAASLAISPLGFPKRPEAPAELTPKQAKLWTRIVSEFPPDYFIAATWPLLSAYCRHVDAVDVLAGQINAFDLAWLATYRGLKRYNKLLGMRSRESAMIASLGTKLRLTQSTRIRAEKRIAIVSGPKPWEKHV